MIKFNGIEVKTPTDIDYEHYNVTNSGRMASGSMSMDLIAKKSKLKINYAVLKGADLRTIKSIIYGPNMFFDVTYYDEDGVIRTITCYVGAITYKKFRTGVKDPLNAWYWKDVEFAVIER